jgi:hypothetical protein
MALFLLFLIGLPLSVFKEQARVTSKNAKTNEIIP